MMFYCYPDGSVIEIGGGNTHPPGWTGQHGNVNRDWVRKPGGEWVASPERSRHRLMEWVESAESAADLIQAITPKDA